MIMSEKEVTVKDEDIIKEVNTEILKLSEQINNLKDKMKTVYPSAEVCEELEEGERKIKELEPWKNYIKVLSKQNEELTKKNKNERSPKWPFFTFMIGGGVFLIYEGWIAYTLLCSSNVNDSTIPSVTNITSGVLIVIIMALVLVYFAKKSIDLFNNDKWG